MTDDEVHRLAQAQDRPKIQTVAVDLPGGLRPARRDQHCESDAADDRPDTSWVRATRCERCQRVPTRSHQTLNRFPGLRGRGNRSRGDHTAPVAWQRVLKRARCIALKPSSSCHPLPVSLRRHDLEASHMSMPDHREISRAPRFTRLREENSRAITGARCSDGRPPGRNANGRPSLTCPLARGPGGPRCHAVGSWNHQRSRHLMPSRSQAADMRP